MDKATQELRRRNKLLQGRRSELPQFEARGLGRKLKSAETFPLKRCEHIEGGTRSYYKKKRKDGTTYSLPFIKGGTRCTNSVLSKGRCLGHLGSDAI